MLLYVLALVALSYVLFIFVSDLLNPFVATKAPLRKRRWRLGRAAAVSSLIAGTLALVLFSLNIAGDRVALGTYLILASIFIAPAVIRHKRSAIWQ